MDLLLLGKTGNGKSATGNTILGRKCFFSNDSTTSVTKEVSYGHVEYKDRVIKVVDGPGVGDTSGIEDLDKATKFVMDAMQDAILLSPNGYHAFLLVVRYGLRFTVEDKEVIRILKAIFGYDFIKNFCVLIVTCGENFEIEERLQNGKSFKTWCKEQKGIFEELLMECDHRTVLFDNITKDESIREKQLNKLIKIVDGLQNNGQRYSDKHFEKVKVAREMLLLEVKEPIIRDETSSKLSIILQSIEKLSNEQLTKKIRSLNELLKDTQDLYDQIVETDKGTGILDSSLSAIKDLEKTLLNKIRDSAVEIIEMGEQRNMENDHSDSNYEQHLGAEAKMGIKKHLKGPEESLNRHLGDQLLKEVKSLSPGNKEGKLTVNVKVNVNENLKARREIFEKLGKSQMPANKSFRRADSEKLRVLERRKSKEVQFFELLKEEQSEREKEQLRIKREREKEIRETALSSPTCSEDSNFILNSLQQHIDYCKELLNKYGIAPADSVDQSVSDEYRIQNAWKAYEEMRQKYDNLLREQLPLTLKGRDQNCPIL